MAIKQKFVIRTGLDVTDSAVFRGSLQVGELSYPTVDADSAGSVMTTDGEGNLSFSKVRFENLNIDFTSLADGSLIIYDSASDKWAAGNELGNVEISQDGGFY
jgi:hypothetical protein